MMNEYILIIFCILLAVTIYYLHEYLKIANTSKPTKQLIKKKQKKTRFNDYNNDYNDLQSLMNVDLDKYADLSKNKRNQTIDNNTNQSFEEESNITD